MSVCVQQKVKMKYNIIDHARHSYSKYILATHHIFNKPTYTKTYFQARKTNFPGTVIHLISRHRVRCCCCHYLYIHIKLPSPTSCINTSTTPTTVYHQKFSIHIKYEHHFICYKLNTINSQLLISFTIQN